MQVFHLHTGRKKKRKLPQTKKLLAAKAQHEQFLTSIGYHKSSDQNKKVVIVQEALRSECAPLSNQIPGNGFKRSLDDYKWKKGCEETHAAITAAEAKRARVAPAFNKGPMMYISEQDDPASLGRKV